MAMPRRWGPGPVFVYESITASRRWQHYAARSLFVLALLASMAVVWLILLDAETRRSASTGSIQGLAELGMYFSYAIATVQVALVLLAAPAATAGAVCLDRARGTLTHMLVTDLSDAEIVLGKLSARLAPVLGLVAAAVPVLAIAALLGGIDPDSLLALTVVSLGLSAFGCALALAVSVRAWKTHEVLMAVYAVWAAWVLTPLFWEIVRGLGIGALGRFPDWLFKLNPFALVWAPHSWPGYVGPADLAVFLAATLSAAVVLVVYSVWRLRGVSSDRARFSWRRASGGTSRRRRAPWWPGPSLDVNPVLWREWHRNRPSRLTRVIWALFVLGSLAGVVLGIVAMIQGGAGTGMQAVASLNGLQVTLALLLVSVLAPTALAEERVRGSLDVLMTTPIPTAAIVRGKWWGMYRVVPRLALFPALAMFVVSLTAPEFPSVPVGMTGRVDPLSDLDRLAAVVLPVSWVLAQGAVITSLGLALATWVSRVGRALAVSVSAYVMMAFGWVFLVEIGLGEVVRMLLGVFGIWTTESYWGDAVIEKCLLGLCPFGGQYLAADALTDATQGERVVSWLMQGVGVLLTAGVAGFFYVLTRLTFERCLGRTSERPRRAPRPLSRASRPTPPHAGTHQTSDLAGAAT